MLAAARTELIRLSAASEDGLSELRWLPTITIGTGEFWTMNDRIAPMSTSIEAMARVEASGFIWSINGHATAATPTAPTAPVAM